MVIAVFASGTEANLHAKAIGRAVAFSGHDLLTGGGGGCMESALQGFKEVHDRVGRSHAILPETKYDPSGYDQVVRTRLEAPKDLGKSPFSRNLVNVAFCHGCVFVSDTLGTLTEVVWMHRVGKPSAFFGSRATWERAIVQLERANAGRDILVSLTTGEDLELAAQVVIARLVEVLEDRLKNI